jgi:hypothetical protein
MCPSSLFVALDDFQRFCPGSSKKAIVPPRKLPAAHKFMSDSIVSIYAAGALEVAYLVRSALEEHGITATISSTQTVGAHELTMIVAPHYVQVHRDDADEARRIVAQLEEAKGRSKKLLDREGEADDDPWPSCPHYLPHLRRTVRAGVRGALRVVRSSLR